MAWEDETKAAADAAHAAEADAAEAVEGGSVGAAGSDAVATVVEETMASRGVEQCEAQRMLAGQSGLL